MASALKQKVFNRICASRSVLTALTGTASHTKVSKAESEKLKSLFKEHKNSLSLDDFSRCCTDVKTAGFVDRDRETCSRSALVHAETARVASSLQCERP